MSGIWEVYWLKRSRMPHILKVGRAWIGGVRNALREQTDPSLPMGADIRSYLETNDCYYRYTICESRDDLDDVYSVLVSRRNVTQPAAAPSGRYEDVRIREADEMTIRRRRAPNEAAEPEQVWDSEVPNMFSVWRELERYKREHGEDS
jgi:hypothetical protein